MTRKNYWERFQRERVSRRRLLAVSGMGAAGLAVAVACGEEKGGPAGETPGVTGTPPTAKPKPGGRYQVATDVNVDTLDPHLSIAGGPAWFPRVYNVLIKQSSQQTDWIFRDLAEEYEIPEPGGLEWIFHIRPGVKIAPNTDGIPERDLDAEDARISFERIKGLPQANAAQFVGKFFASHEASPDGKTYTVRTPTPYAYFQLNIGGALFTSTIPPREVIEKGEDFMKQNAVGAGPFFVRPGSYIEGQGLTLDRNPNYYRKDEDNDNAQIPYVEGIDAKIIPDRPLRRAAFIAKQSYDYGTENIEEAEELLGQYDIYETRGPVNSFVSFTMNVTREPWTDPRIRKAAMYALNRQQYIDLVYKGDAQANGLVHWPQGAYALPPEELELLQPFDPERSKQLIREATGQDRIGIKVMFPGNSTIWQHDRQLPIWLEQMKAAGFDVDQDVQDFGMWLDNYQNINYDASLALNQIYETPEIPIDFQHSDGPAGSGIYATGLQDPEVDAAIKASKEITDPEELVQAIQEVQRLIYDKGPAFLPIVSSYSHTVYWNFVKNVPEGLGVAGDLVNTRWLDL